MRDFLIQHWGLNQDQVGVVYHGAESPLGHIAATRPQPLDGLNSVRFLFTAGSIRPARGLEDIIRATARINQNGMPYVLVIGGEVNPDAHVYFERMKRLAIDCGVADRVVWTGHLTAREMAWCFYNCADLRYDQPG